MPKANDIVADRTCPHCAGELVHSYAQRKKCKGSNSVKLREGKKHKKR